MATDQNAPRKERSSTIPTKASTSTTSSLGKSKRVLVYDFAENKTRRMSRAKFDKEYSGTSEIVTIPIPKGASKVDVSPDDLTPDSQASTDSTGTNPSQINTSYIASVHIPAAVFWQRALISTDRYPELTIVSSNSSPSSSRSNTSRENTMSN